jgi:hypothetical protein
MMMDMPIFYLTIAATILAATALIAVTGLRGFHAWIDLKRAELQMAGTDARPSAVNRIELADLKERMRKLEAIAAGVDL